MKSYSYRILDSIKNTSMDALPLSPSNRIQPRGRVRVNGQLEVGDAPPMIQENFRYDGIDVPNRNNLVRTRLVDKNDYDGYKFAPPVEPVPGQLVVRNPGMIGPVRPAGSYAGDGLVFSPAVNNGGSPVLGIPAGLTVTDPRGGVVGVTPDNYQRPTYPNVIWDTPQPDIRQQQDMRFAAPYGVGLDGYRQTNQGYGGQYDRIRDLTSGDPLINPLGRQRPTVTNNGRNGPAVVQGNQLIAYGVPPYTRQLVSNYVPIREQGEPYRDARAAPLPTELAEMKFEVDFLHKIETHPDKKAQLNIISRQLSSYGQKQNDVNSIGNRIKEESTRPKVRTVIDDSGKEYQTFSPSVDPKKASINIGKNDEIIVTGIVFPPMEVINKSSGPLDSEAIRKYIRWMLIFLIIAVILILLYVVYRFARWLFCWESCDTCNGRKGKCSC